ncbi:unnamed protein product [Diatraea saccharalis]|uniref:Cuticle protein 16.5 n=1 Tax=Diatraea saccharalis TaxID=40085 RepID=A0A9N9WJ76_9NEOP|nr:unnamed protein product [Diatraea saccharalis]
MYKLVVLTFLAVAAAEPGAVIVGPAAYSTLIAPATTTIAKQATSVVHPSPFIYSAPLAYSHFIKKRSAPVLPLAPATYYAGSPVIGAPLATTYSAPLLSSASLLPAVPVPYAAAHLIKKRSAPFLPAVTTYAATAPILASTYAAAPLHSVPLIASTPLISQPTYAAHLIKKRSAPLLTSYAAFPSSFSHQSRVDLTHSGPAVVTSYSSPIAYSSPIGFSHVI